MSSRESNEDQNEPEPSSDAGNVDAAGATLNGDLDTIFDDDDFMDDDNRLPPQLTSMYDTSKTVEPGAVISMGYNKYRASTSDRNVQVGTSWQDDSKVMQYRKILIKDIAYLLKDRKVNPTEKWIKELPYKARKLEEQLYKSSPSLEAYLDKSTLKHRLKKVAHAITSQFRLSKDGKKKTSSTTSRRSDTVTSDITSSMISPDLNLSAASFCSLSASGVDPEISQRLLQEQILENIRQQQIIMKSLMMAQNQQQGGPLSNNPIMDSQNSMMAGFEQRMLGGQANNANVGGVENMLLQQAQMGFGGAGLNMSPMGNSWSSQQLAIMNNMGFEAPSGMGNLGPGSTGGMQGLIGMNSMNGMDPNQLYQNQFMLRNANIGGSANPATTMAMNQANMEGSVIPGPSMSSGMNTGVHPTMPPPAFGVLGRSSFTNGSLNTNERISEDNLSLSPNSFNW